MEIFWIMLAVVLAVTVSLFRWWHIFLGNFPPIKEVWRDFISGKSRKGTKFYEEGYADEIDEPDEKEQNSKSSHR